MIFGQDMSELAQLCSCPDTFYSIMRGQGIKLLSYIAKEV